MAPYSDETTYALPQSALPVRLAAGDPPRRALGDPRLPSRAPVRRAQADRQSLPQLHDALQRLLQRRGAPRRSRTPTRRRQPARLRQHPTGLPRLRHRRPGVRGAAPRQIDGEGLPGGQHPPPQRLRGRRLPPPGPRPTPQAGLRSRPAHVRVLRGGLRPRERGGATQAHREATARRREGEREGGRDPHGATTPQSIPAHRT